MLPVPSVFGKSDAAYFLALTCKFYQAWLQFITLTHYRSAMPFRNRKFYFGDSFQFRIITIYKISPLWKPVIGLFRHFSKLKVSYFTEKSPSNFP